MVNPFYIFKIKHEERYPAIAALLYVLLWNILVIHKYADKFFALTDNYHDHFIKYFVISGFDPWSYAVLSKWDTEYNIYRHPLLAFFMWIPAKINQGLMMLTGMNWATIIMAIILVFCAFYSFILLQRTFHEVIGLKRSEAWLLGWLTFSFGYVMVAISVPDHFCLSMFMLILTIYVAGRKLKAKHPFTKWQTILFFIITAGISLNNGIKVFLANLFVNGKMFWRPANLILAIIMPSLLIWGTARLEWKHFEEPKTIAQQKEKMKKDSMLRGQIYERVRDTISQKDSASIQAAYNNIIRQRIIAKYKRDHNTAWNKNAGKPMNKTEFGQWTDISTPRLPSLVENIMGEPIQLHQDYLLHDVERNRPIIVNYRYAFNYIIEAIVALFFIFGIICGRKEKLLWLALSFMGFDMIIHFVLGFGINEAYIMSPHWLFIISLFIACLVKRTSNNRMHKPIMIVLSALTVYLLLWNGSLYASYLMQ